MGKKKRVEIVAVNKAVADALAAAQDAEEVLVICLHPESGVEMHTSLEYPPDMLWVLELAKEQAMEMSNHTND